MINKAIPYFLYRRLWGDRKCFGNKIDVNDSEWMMWQEKAYSDFYQNTQQKGIGNAISKMAYFVVSQINFSGKTVLEIGPGIIRHLEYLQSDIRTYVICDINKDFLKYAENQLIEHNINYKSLIKERKDHSLPLKDHSIDILITFNSLEHLNPLENSLQEFDRVLCTGGRIVGGIPCEGGLAWGLGRYLTTKRYVHKNYGINYDKIICWEHPNFADFIIEKLDEKFTKQYLKLHPFPFLPIDFNLIASFIYVKT